MAIEKKIGTLGLELVIQDKQKKTSLEMNPKSILDWRNHLPIADNGTTAKKVFMALNDLNQSIINLKNRFEITELLRPSVQLVCLSLRKHYVNQTKNLTTKQITITRLAETLQLEMANSYKTILEELCQQESNNETHKKKLAITIFRIMHYFNCILQRRYLLYLEPPKNIWKEMNILYKIAKKKDILHESLIVEISTSKSKQTIFTCYMRSLLMASSNPYQWRQNEQSSLNNVFDIWTEHVNFRRYASTDEDYPGIYIINMSKDLSPIPLKLFNGTDKEKCMVLDLKKEAKHIKELLSQVEKDDLRIKLQHQNDPEFSIGATTLKRLYKEWSTIIERHHPRFDLPGKMKIAFGLSSCHFFISGGKFFDPQALDKLIEQERLQAKYNFDDTFADADADDPFADADDPFADADDSLITEHENHNTGNDNAELEETLKESNNCEEYTINYCDIIDISPAGVCLVWNDDSHPPMQAGELVSFKYKEESEQSPWNVGIIRWVKNSNHKNLRIGIQLLCSKAEAVGAQILKNDVPAGYLVRCLCLKPLPEEQSTETILTPTIPFKPGKTVMLMPNSQKKITIILDEIIDATSSYRQFSYTEFNPNEALISEDNKSLTEDSAISTPNNTETEGPIDDDDDFADIWKEI